jgi:hypothetical protein
MLRPTSKNTPLVVALDSGDTGYFTDAGNDRALKIPAG